MTLLYRANSVGSSIYVASARDGEDGEDGIQGSNGKSAYEIALDNGFVGTEEEWLESLQNGPAGPQGEPGADGNDGADGADGDTGPAGPQGTTGPQGLQGPTGPAGSNGTNGSQGIQGIQGVKGDKGDTGDTPPLASIAETNTGTDATKAVSADGLAGSTFGKRVVCIQVTDPNGSAITTGDGKAYFTVPAELTGMNLVAAHASLTTTASGSSPLIQIANVTDTVDMLSTRITIDTGELTSYTATTSVVDATKDDVVTGDLLRIDIDTAGTGAKGLQAILSFQLP